MRKLVHFLHSTFGSQYNAEINSIVSNWYHHNYSIRGIDVTLSDVSEDGVVSVLGNFIEENEVTFKELEHLIVAPCLAENRFDLNARVLAMPELIINRLAEHCTLEVGFWTGNDEVVNTGTMAHISVVKGAAGDMLGGYVNGTFSDGELFSIAILSDEIIGSLEFGLEKGMNGVQVSDFIKNQLTINVLIARMLDSAVGFRLADEVNCDQLLDMLKIREVASDCDDGKVFSTWGQVIGKKVRVFTVDDKLSMEKAHKEAVNRTGRLTLVSNVNDAATQAPAVSNVITNEKEEEELAWGQF